MKDKKINIFIIIICIALVISTYIFKITSKEDKKNNKVTVTTTEKDKVSYDNADMDQYLHGNTLKNDTGEQNEDAYDTVESIVKVSDDTIEPIFTEIPEIENSLPSMIESKIMEQNIDLGLNSTVTVHPEPKTFNETENMISFEMFFDELVEMIHIEYVKESGEMKVIIYERTKENLKKYGWDKVLEENYNISIN